MDTYDVITVGGGLGGAALAKCLAESGMRVLILERTREFKDRVRGEVLVPWGCADAQRLGLYDALHDACGHELRWWDADINGNTVLHRDIPATCLPGLPVLTYFHPDMQNLLLEAATAAGAEVRRGAVVRKVLPGSPARVTWEHAGQKTDVEARLVVGCDGRDSSVRAWGGFTVQRDPQRRFFAGVLLDNLAVPQDTMHSRFAPSEGLMSWLFPQGGGRVRAYVGFPAASNYTPFSGSKSIGRFVQTSAELGVPKDALAGATVAGPLATFDGTDNWVEHPYGDGVALIGDAAANGDPTWGQGMSVTLRSVRLLSEQLLAGDDWDAAGHAYAQAFNAAYQACRTCDTWYTDIFLGMGPDADARRAHALPLVLQDPTRIPDTPLSGPEWVPDEAARQRFFGEDVDT